MHVTNRAAKYVRARRRSLARVCIRSGRGSIKRERNKRGTFDVNECRDEPVSCNYYPITTHAYIKDSNAQLTVLTDRAQGAASLTDGEIEVMLHRRILVDDNRGVAEALNETDAGMTGWPDWQREGKGLVMIGHHKVFIGHPESTARNWKPTMHAMFSTLTPFITVGGRQLGDASSSPADFLLADSLLSDFMPAQVEVMTLQLISGNSVLLRLQHQYDEGEDKDLGSCVDVDIVKMFGAMRIKSVTEMSLTNNQKKADMKRLKWTTSGAADDRRTGDDTSSFNICPTEIRTFVMELQ